jgi:hypothetical protein
LSLVAACSTRPEAPALDIASIDPADTNEGQAVAVRIQGQGFHAVIKTDLDDGTSNTAEIAVTVGGVALDAMVLQSEALIEGTVPGTLAPGGHDVVVTAGEQTATLPAAFRVYQRCDIDADCDDGDPCTTAESCEDQRCVNAGPDKDTDGDGFVDDACGGADCDDDDELENPNATWYPDGDNDGSGDAAANGNACERAAASDVDNASDCDDSNELVFGGSNCDDGDACTEVDTCTLGTCAGVDSCTMSCEDTCAGGCGPDRCCIETCTGACPTCSNNCSCDQACTAPSCSAFCASDSTCRLSATADSASMSCSSRSTCTLACSGGDECVMSCASDALCLVVCGGAATCDIDCSGGVTADCGGGVLVCHRECP